MKLINMNIRTALAVLHESVNRLEAKGHLQLAQRVHETFVKLAEELYDTSRDRFPKYEYTPMQKDPSMGNRVDAEPAEYMRISCFVFPRGDEWYADIRQRDIYSLDELSGKNVIKIGSREQYSAEIVRDYLSDILSKKTGIRPMITVYKSELEYMANEGIVPGNNPFSV